MANTVSSIYMNLPVPVPSVDPGPQYAIDLNSCLTILDSHNHSPGLGQQITPAGINITSDLSFGGFNGINYRSVRFTAQSSPISAGTDIGCLYVATPDLYYNDSNGNRIRLTQSGAVAGTPGSIGNLVFPASVTYNSSNQTFVFQSSTATAGNIDAGSLIIRPIIANANGVTISATVGTNAYTLSLPKVLPSSAAYVTVDTSGNLSYSTYGLSKPLTSSSAAGLGGIASSISCGSFTSGNTKFTNVISSATLASLQTQLVTSGVRPIFVGTTPDGSSGSQGAYLPTGVAGNATATIRFIRVQNGSSAVVGLTQMGVDAGAVNVTTVYPAGSVYALDYPGTSGTVNYTLQVANDNSNQTFAINNIKIITYEL